MIENLIIYKDINKECCPFCGTQKLKFSDKDDCILFTDCRVCGRYVINASDFEKLENKKNEISAILYHSKHNDTRIIGDDNFYEKYNNLYARSRFIPIDSINNFYPQKFSEKVENMLLAFSKKSQFFGDVVTYSEEEFCSAAYLKRFNAHGEKLEPKKIKEQIKKMQNFLTSEPEKYVHSEPYDVTNSIEIELLAKGWQRIENIESTDKNNKNVFIAMSFAKETGGTREALKKGIINAGYNPILIDEVTHNQQIVPEMFKQIRKSKFLVIDISVPNTGAYYEAGYAKGLGKEVIFCCSQESFSNQDKNMRPHFDVSQKQMIVWNDENDLLMKLEKWILSLF